MNNNHGPVENRFICMLSVPLWALCQFSVYSVVRNTFFNINLLLVKSLVWSLISASLIRSIPEPNTQHDSNRVRFLSKSHVYSVDYSH